MGLVRDASSAGRVRAIIADTPGSSVSPHAVSHAWTPAVAAASWGLRRAGKGMCRWASISSLRLDAGVAPGTSSRGPAGRPTRTSAGTSSCVVDTVVTRRPGIRSAKCGCPQGRTSFASHDEGPRPERDRGARLVVDMPRQMAQPHTAGDRRQPAENGIIARRCSAVTRSGNQRSGRNRSGSGNDDGSWCRR